MGFEQRDVVIVRAPPDFTRDDFANLVDAVPCDQAAFHRLDEVTAFFFRLLDRVGRYERAPTDGVIVELPGIESVRSDGVDVTSRGQPISVDD